MSSSSPAPDTIVLVHGFWVTPRSWEDWIAHYEKKGYTVLAPAYPGFEVEVEALNADSTPIVKATVPEIIATYEAAIDALDAPPIIFIIELGARRSINLDYLAALASCKLARTTSGPPVALTNGWRSFANT